MKSKRNSPTKIKARRSERLVECLTSTDLTPRTGPEFVVRQEEMGVEEQLYDESKLALTKGQF